MNACRRAGAASGVRFGRRRSAPLLARGHQHGAAALVVTVLLCFAMALAVAYVHRSLLIEQRTAAHQVRATQAFEAAEAGIEWTLAALNDNRRVGDDCVPSREPTAASLRDRLLRRATADAPFGPRTWLDRGIATPLQVACEAAAGGWRCSCPSAAAPSLRPAPDSRAASFTVEFATGDAPGLVKIAALGCSGSAAACASAAGHPSSARITASFALLRGLTSSPAAPLVARGSVDGDGVAWGARNDDASLGGLAVHAGGDVHAAGATLQGPAGGDAGERVMANDVDLAARTPARFFGAFFGIDDKRWAERAGVTRLACPHDCGPALARAIADGGGNALIAVDGDLAIGTPVTLGTAERPVVVVARGAVSIDARTELHGVLFGATLAATPGAAGSLVHGAALSAGAITLAGPADFVADAGLLARLKRDTGTFARVSGSWRDF